MNISTLAPGHGPPSTLGGITLLILLLAAGCSTLRWTEGEQLREGDMDKLRARSIRADQEGFRLQPLPEGDYDVQADPSVLQDRTTRVPLVSSGSISAPPLIRMRLNGHTAYALVDTGSAQSLSDWRGALRMDLHPLQHPQPDREHAVQLVGRKLTGLGATRRAYAARADTLRLGALQIGPSVWWIVDHPRGLFGYGWLGKRRVELVLGYDLLRTIDHVTFDPATPAITFSHQGPYQPGPNAGMVLPFRAGLGLPILPGTLNGQPALFGLDTGGDFELWVPPGLAQRYGLDGPGHLQGLRRGEGLGGPTLSVPHPAVQVRLADQVLGQLHPQVSLIEPGEQATPFLLIGQRVLRRYRMTLDHVMGLVYLEPR